MRKKWNELLQILNPMTGRQRLEYLWEYYKLIPISLVIIIALLASWIPNLIQENKDIIYGGMVLNVDLSDETTKALDEDLFTYLGGTDTDKEKMVLNYARSYGADAADVEAAYYSNMAIIAQVATGDIDYILTDMAGVEFSMLQGISCNPEELLPAQYSETLQDRLVHLETEGTSSACAIDISDTAFAAACGMDKTELYLIFTGSTNRSDKIDEFIDYLLNWESGE